MADRVNILIVDDEPKNLMVLETVLDDPGYRLVRARSGEEALLALMAEEFAVLVLDVRMPGMSGPELAKAALRLRPRLKVVFTSGYVDERALPEEAPFVPKPWRVDQVSEAITAAAGSRSAD
jgi:CheY-like chemotaxis protein